VNDSIPLPDESGALHELLGGIRYLAFDARLSANNFAFPTLVRRVPYLARCGGSGRPGVDDVAVAMAVGRIELALAPGEFLQVPAGLLELDDALLDLVETLVDELADVRARRLTAVSNLEDLPDLAEGEAAGLRVANECHTLERVGRVVAVTGPGSCRRQQPFVLVEAQGLCRRARAAGDLTDEHGPGLPA